MNQFISKTNFQYIWNNIKKTFATKDEVALKANISTLDNYATLDAVDKKADKTALDSLATKAEITALASKEEVALKADKTELDALATKAELEPLATKTAVEAKLDKTALDNLATKTELAQKVDIADLDSYVEKIDGKGLSTNDFTDTLKTKLTSIEAGAQANVIESVVVDGTQVAVTDKAVNLNLAGRYATKAALDQKVDAVAGKTLTSNDFTDSDKEKLDAIASGAEVNTIVGVKVDGTTVEPTSRIVNIDLTGKVDKVDGKVLTDNNFSNDDKAKLDGIAIGAQANVIEGVRVNGVPASIVDKAAYIDLTPYATLAAVENGYVAKQEGKGLSTHDLTDALLNKIQHAGDSSFSGNYEDLINKPDIAAEAMNAFDASDYKTTLETINSDYITSAGLAEVIAETGHIKFEFVDSLPETGVANTIYFCKENEAANEYSEYVYNSDTWVKCGVRNVDFSGVWSKDELTATTNAELDVILGISAE